MTRTESNSKGTIVGIAAIVPVIALISGASIRKKLASEGGTLPRDIVSSKFTEAKSVISAQTRLYVEAGRVDDGPDLPAPLVDGISVEAGQVDDERLEDGIPELQMKLNRSSSATIAEEGQGVAPSQTCVATDGGVPVDVGEDAEDEMSRLREVKDLVRFLTQDTRYKILVDIVGHPEGMPSLEELAYTNPSKSKSTIKEHLDKLQDAGVVKKVSLPKGEQQRDLPNTFYRMTREGYDFLMHHDLIPAERAQLREHYDRIEKTERIQAYEAAPRPTPTGSKQQTESEEPPVVQLVKEYQAKDEVTAEDEEKKESTSKEVETKEESDEQYVPVSKLREAFTEVVEHFEAEEDEENTVVIGTEDDKAENGEDERQTAEPSSSSGS